MEKKDKENQTMRILIIRTFPDKLNLNSYNVQEIGLARALTIKGHHCDIVLYGGREHDKEETYSFVQNGKEYSFLIYWLKGYAIFKNGFMPSVNKLITRYDVIQVHEYDQILSWRLYSRPQRPTVIYHGPYYHPYARGYNFKCKVFDMLFLRRRNYDNVIALTKSKMAADFLKNKGFRHVLPVGVGVNVDNFHLSVREAGSALPPKSKKQFRLLYVGKIEERRNVYFLIKVFRKLLQDHPTIQLILVGDGEEKYKEEFLKSIKRELKDQTIIHRTKATQAELAGIYQKADAFLFTSNYEIFGMVLLEAMYFGLPVVSTLNGGSSMLIQDDENGYILKEFDVAQWSEKLRNLLENQDKLQNMGQCAKRTVEEGFTWERLADKFESAYEQAVERYRENEQYKSL